MTSHTSSACDRDAVTAEGEVLRTDPGLLQYTTLQPPGLGEAVQITAGVKWLRIPLPMELDHINTWLLHTVDGYLAVDTGMGAAVGEDAWEQIAAELFSAQPLRGIFITHIHPDHIGLAAWLQQRHQVPLMMSARTRDLAQMLLGNAASAQREEAEAFFRAHGVDDPAVIQGLFRPDRFARMTSGLPRVDRLIADAEILDLGAYRWQALETHGHAEGHLCLWDAQQRVLISGDQVLPTISSNISLLWRNQDRDPLRSYMQSLRRLRQLDPRTLVLPSHGLPFVGLQCRIDDLLQHHEAKLARLESFCSQPRLAVEVLSVLFRRELKGTHLFLALAEALAHLEYLANAGRAERHIERGQVRYVRRRG